MKEAKLRSLLADFRRGRLGSDGVVERLARLPYEDAGFALLDSHREIRGGMPEAIFGPGKSATELEAAVRRTLRAGGRVLATRLTEERGKALKKKFPHLELERAGLHSVLYSRPEQVRKKPRPAVLTAGSSDIPVAREAAAVLRAMGYDPAAMYDVGAAGLHRLFDRMESLRSADVLIVAAGMDGVLPGIVASLVRAPVIGVPTSTGYGAGTGGVGALVTMLNSCSGKLLVVNIDNGFGAASAAVSILRKITP